jgi:DNA polymerase I-like protein with 3'-5' exonuclease and polymerase domains
LKLNKLTVGQDRRNRYLLGAFSTKTGRNAPSNSKSIFGPATWLRSLIQPPPGHAVAYIDWSAQEVAIAAVLSGDNVLRAAYESGDPHLFLAKQAGAVPPDATKNSHPAERERFKVVTLGVQYGLSEYGLARRLNISLGRAHELLRAHRQTFGGYWKWSDAAETQAMLSGRLRTLFGWPVHVPPAPAVANPRSLRNFLIQGTGAEMLRLACCLATERGIAVCAPVHDALMVEAPAAEIEAVVEATKRAMKEASRVVLYGFEVRTDAKVVRHPDRYSDPRGERMWKTICGLLGGRTPA